MRASSGKARTGTAGDRALALIRRREVVRASDFSAVGVDRKALTRLEAQGRIERRTRGVYSLVNPSLHEETLVATAARFPRVVFCLLTALRFHVLTTQAPWDVWVAIERGDRAPRASDISLRVIRMSGEAFASGIETHRLHGVDVRVYSPAKTVVDCYKFRNTTGIDVALEATRDFLRPRGRSIEEVWRYAAADRMENVMRPYLEAIVSV
jgi:predicted transcriptional regulator of viral defense system